MPPFLRCMAFALVTCPEYGAPMDPICECTSADNAFDVGPSDVNFHISVQRKQTVSDVCTYMRNQAVSAVRRCGAAQLENSVLVEPDATLAAVRQAGLEAMGAFPVRENVPAAEKMVTKDHLFRLGLPTSVATGGTTSHGRYTGGT